jgi:uncharacterized protein YggE
MPPVDTSGKNVNSRPALTANRIIVLVLLLIIGGMLLLWKPWEAETKNDRTVEVSGEAKLSETPDEYTFNPSYQFKNTNRDVALEELTKKNEEVNAKLKELGVKEVNIKTNTSGYDASVYTGAESKAATYTLQLAVKTDSKEIAQKIQNYLISTVPIGAVSPQMSFSDAKRKELEAKAREAATKDARAKADQMAGNLGFKVGKIKSLSDQPNGDGGVRPLLLNAEDGAARSASSQPQLGLQPGQNDFSYSVKVIYYIR